MVCDCILIKSFSGGWVRFQPKKQQKITTFWLRRAACLPPAPALRPCLPWAVCFFYLSDPHTSTTSTTYSKESFSQFTSCSLLLHLNEIKVSDFGVSYYSCRTRTQLAPTKMNPPINEEETSRISMDALQNNMKQVDVAR